MCTFRNRHHEPCSTPFAALTPLSPYPRRTHEVVDSLTAHFLQSQALASALLNQKAMGCNIFITLVVVTMDDLGSC